MKRKSAFDRKIEQLTREAIAESLLTIERILVSKYRIRRSARGPVLDCPGHVASPSDAQVCGRCGIHINELRPEEETL